MGKTKEEILEEYKSEFLDVVRMEIDVDGFDEKVVYSTDMEVVPEKMHMILPEYCTYHLTIYYRVKKRAIKNLHYYHGVKKAGIAIKTRNLDIGDVEPNEGDTLHKAVFEADTLPGGYFIRGTYPANTIFLEDKKPIFNFDWNIEIAKKDVKPSIKI